MRNTKRPFTILLCLAAVLGLTACSGGGPAPSDSGSSDDSPGEVPTPPPVTEYYQTYAEVDPNIASPEGCTGMQAFGMGDDYCYCVKVNTGKLTKAILYRTSLSDGSTVLMTNGDDGTDYCTYLSHANDMVLCSIDGQDYLFIVTMLENEWSLVKLRYEDTTYYKAGNYSVQLGSITKSMSGVKILGMDDNAIQFLFKSGKTYYTGTLPLDTNDGVIQVEQSFVLDISSALVGGQVIPNISQFANQGFEYYNDTIFHPLTKGNTSVVLVYRNISQASGTIYADPELSFQIVSTEYEKLFEIEGVGHAPDGKLYFNTNRAKTDGTQADGIHYFEGYRG